MTFRQTDAQRRLAAASTSGATRIMAFGGSRSGKTFEIIREIATIALVAGGRHAIFRKTFNSVKTSVFGDTLPKVLDLCYPGQRAELNKSDYVVRFPETGGEIWALGLDDKERVDKILGKEFATVYFNESSEISWHAVETALTRLSQRVPGLRRNLAFFDCNPPTKSHWTYKLFVKRVDPVTNAPLVNPDDYVALRLNPTDNAANLPDGYIDRTLATLSGKKRDRFLLGEWTDDAENALWKASQMIDPFRLSLDEARRGGDFERVVVGVDPAVTSAEASDETGIVVAARRGVGDKAKFYVLEDATVQTSPERWARAVASAVERWGADRVVAEVNNGGDLVVSNLRRAAPNLPVKSVRATRGKILRAEPVAALYEQGRVHHVGLFEVLEEQMTSYVGDVSEKSPDRLDALVWALTELSATRGGVSHGEYQLF